MLFADSVSYAHEAYTEPFRWSPFIMTTQRGQNILLILSLAALTLIGLHDVCGMG